MPRLLPAVLIAFAAATAARAAPSCHGLSATAVAFSAYDVYSAAQQAVQGSIIYNCPPPINPTVTVDGGLHLSGGQRNMLLTTGPDLLRYGLFFDAACTQVISPTATTAIAAGSGTITFYACLPPLQDVSVGSYGDTVTVTFNF